VRRPRPVPVPRLRMLRSRPLGLATDKLPPIGWPGLALHRRGEMKFKGNSFANGPGSKYGSTYVWRDVPGGNPNRSYFDEEDNHDGLSW